MWMNPRLITLLLLTPTSLLHIFKKRGIAHVLSSSKTNLGSSLEFKWLKTNHDAKKTLYYSKLPESFQVLQTCSAYWKNQGQATGFLLTYNSNNNLKPGVPHPFPLGLLQSFLYPGNSCQKQWELLLIEMGWQFSSSCGEYGSLHWAIPTLGRVLLTLLTLLPNIIALLEENKDAFDQAGKQKSFFFLLLFHK